MDDIIDKLRYTGKVHKMMGDYIKSQVRPGIKYIDVCNVLETTNYDHITPAFPTCISCNNVVAHYSPTKNSNDIFKYNDVVKIDYGYKYDGYIIDSAFTLIFNPVFDSLIECATDAVMSTIKMARPDILLNELSENIKEIIESYTLITDGKIYDIRSSKNLGGHTIKKNLLHADKFLPGVPSKSNEGIRMSANEIWAIEVFPTTGEGIVRESKDMKCTNYGLVNNNHEICKLLYEKYNMLPFNIRWIENDLNMLEFNDMLNIGYIKKYKPLVDSIGSYSSQVEHTIFVGEYNTEVFTL